MSRPLQRASLGSRLAVCAFLVLSSLGFGNAQASGVAEHDTLEAFVDGVVNSAMHENDVSAGVVTIMKDGEVILSKGYGQADPGSQKPVDPATSLFRIGSVSKLFTWVSVMQLVEQGRLDLDADVNSYLTSFKIEDSWPGQPVTLRHIMTHTAGFEANGLGQLVIDDPARIVELGTALERSQPARVVPPGQRVSYSNWATALAGLIVADVTGQEFPDYAQEHIFDVLGMDNTTFAEPVPDRMRRNLVVAYGRAQAMPVPRNFTYITNYMPAGATTSSASDMTLFARALLNGGAIDDRRILEAQTLRQMLDEGFAHDDRVRGMALGFIEFAHGPRGFDSFGHDGGTPYFTTHFGLSQPEDLMVFSSFAGEAAPLVHVAFTREFYARYYPGDEAPIAPPQDFKDRAEKYVGTYQPTRSSFTKIDAIMRPLASLDVVGLPDNTLLVGPDRYVEIAENLFRKVEGPERIAFQEGAEGKIESFVQDGMGVMLYERAPFYESLPFIAALVGLPLVIFLAVILRVIFQWPAYRKADGWEKRSASASLAVAISNWAFWILAIIAMAGGIVPLMFAIPLSLKLALVFPIIAVLATVYLLYQMVVGWRTRGGASVWARVRVTLVSVAALAMVWFNAQWNLLGFNYLT